MKRIAIVGTLGEELDEFADIRTRWRFPLEYYCDTIQTNFMNLQHLRLHIDHGNVLIDGRTPLERFDLVVTLPGLVDIELQVPQDSQKKATSLGKGYMQIWETGSYHLNRQKRYYEQSYRRSV